jgi:hypothetical protein
LRANPSPPSSQSSSLTELDKKNNNEKDNCTYHDIFDNRQAPRHAIDPNARQNLAMAGFDINDALKHYMSDPASILTPEADSALFDCENDPEALTNAVVNAVVNPIVDAVADNPDAIARPANLDSLQFLLKLAPISPISEPIRILFIAQRGLI